MRFYYVTVKKKTFTLDIESKSLVDGFKLYLDKDGYLIKKINGKKYVSYDAIYEIFRILANDLSIKEVAIPKIGCGLAGGNWEIVSRIINDATGDDLGVYVYYLEDKWLYFLLFL